MGSFRSAASRLYPGEFRAEWGAEMTLLYQDRSREEPLPSLLFAVVVDTLKTAPREHYAMWSQDLATLGPAWRAARVDPLRALRSE